MTSAAPQEFHGEGGPVVVPCCRYIVSTVDWGNDKWLIVGKSCEGNFEGVVNHYFNSPEAAVAVARAIFLDKQNHRVGCVYYKKP